MVTHRPVHPGGPPAGVRTAADFWRHAADPPTHHSGSSSSALRFCKVGCEHTAGAAGFLQMERAAAAATAFCVASVRN